LRSGRSTDTAPFDRDRLTWLSYLVLGCCGYVQGSLGPAASHLRVELRFDYTMVSLHMTAFAGGMVFAGAPARHLSRIVDRRGLLWIGGAGLAIGAVLLTMSPDPLWSVLVAFLTGLLACWAVIVVQAVLSQRHDAQRATALTEANLGGSIGSAIAMSCLAALTASRMTWRAGLFLPMLVVGVLALAYRREPVAIQLTDSAGETDRPNLPKRFWAFWMTLVLAVGIEWSVSFWAVPYLRDALGLSDAIATVATAGLFAAVVIGRMLGSRWTRRQSADQLLPKSLFLTLAGVVLLLPGSVPLGLLGLMIAGLGIANLYPLALSLGMRVASENADYASTRCTAAVGLALMVFPLTVGRVADVFNIRVALATVVLVLVVFALFARWPRVWPILRQLRDWPSTDRVARLIHAITPDPLWLAAVPLLWLLMDVWRRR
jgi:MFS family permease